MEDSNWFRTNENRDTNTYVIACIKASRFMDEKKTFILSDVLSKDFLYYIGWDKLLTA